MQDAEKFLNGKSTDIQGRLATEMAEASEAMEFERAAALRDRIKALTQVQTAQGINPQGVAEADIIALHMDQGQACVQVFFIRANQNWGNRDYYPRVGPDVDAAEVLEAFIGQFYDTREPPRQLILSNEIESPDLMVEALSGKLGRKVDIVVPKRGEKAELVDGALRNARESLARKLAETATQTNLLKGIADAFDLPAPPQRIEVYDNSHIQGTNAVGGMIVAGPDGMMKNQYRKFNIRGDDLTPGARRPRWGGRYFFLLVTQRLIVPSITTVPSFSSIRMVFSGSLISAIGGTPHVLFAPIPKPRTADCQVRH